MTNIPVISPAELKEKFDNSEDIFILDVREPNEYEICNLTRHLIPLNTLPSRIHELDSNKEIVVYCHTGIRSAYAVNFLLQHGFNNVKNLIN